jgi:hypothetical protein
MRNGSFESSESQNTPSQPRRANAAIPTATSTQRDITGNRTNNKAAVTRKKLTRSQSHSNIPKTETVQGRFRAKTSESPPLPPSDNNSNIIKQASFRKTSIYPTRARRLTLRAPAPAPAPAPRRSRTYKKRRQIPK